MAEPAPTGRSEQQSEQVASAVVAMPVTQHNIVSFRLADPTARRHCTLDEL